MKKVHSFLVDSSAAINKTPLAMVPVFITPLMITARVLTTVGYWGRYVPISDTVLNLVIALLLVSQLLVSYNEKSMWRVALGAGLVLLAVLVDYVIYRMPYFYLQEIGYIMDREAETFYITLFFYITLRLALPLFGFPPSGVSVTINLVRLFMFFSLYPVNPPMSDTALSNGAMYSAVVASLAFDGILKAYTELNKWRKERSQSFL